MPELQIDQLPRQNNLLDAFRGTFSRVIYRPATPLWEPTFERVQAFGPAYPQPRWLCPLFFATMDTTERLIAELHGTEIVEVTALGNEGPLYTASHKQRWIVFAKDSLDTQGNRRRKEVRHIAGLMARDYAQQAGMRFVTGLLDPQGTGHWERTGKSRGATHELAIQWVANFYQV